MRKLGLKNKDTKNTWIIDPIDGTINFLHGIPHFAISIGMMSNNEIKSGLIFDPIKNEMFYAEKNNGALIMKELEFLKRMICQSVYLQQVGVNIIL